MRNVFGGNLNAIISTSFIVLMIAVIVVVSSILLRVAQPVLENNQRQKVIELGSRIVAGLGRPIAVAETVASSLASVYVKLPPGNYRDVKKILPGILDQPNEFHFIVGGGIWPEP